MTATPVAVTTYHNDAMRTGWNPNETLLTPATVRSTDFGLLGTVAVDQQVDAEPLYVPNVPIAGGKHNVVYVVTENDTVYAIDADAGTVLLSRNLGTPVPLSALPGQCNNNSNSVGITGTPTIDLTRQALYLVTYTYEQNAPVYRMHALSLATLGDTVPSVVVTASQTLTNNQGFKFNAAVNRQRTALLEANGNIYAAFTSFCDLNANITRGWILGWNAKSLAPLSGNGMLLDRLASSPKNFFLSTIWMSGFGPAADESGNVFFVTGNSDPKGTSENGSTNLGESVVRLSPDLSKVQSYFTPSGKTYGPTEMDAEDADFGSGGVTLIPSQGNGQPRLAVAAGKMGIMYVMNRDSLGGYTAGGPDQVFGNENIGGCWCGASYYQGADGVGRIVSSGAPDMTVWTIGGGKQPTLNYESNVEVGQAQYQGFFTAVSSNGTQAGSHVLWAVTRPTGYRAPTVGLYAFDPSHIDAYGRSTALFGAAAGSWPNTNSNPNIVPLVANGRVYVASYKAVEIFGLKTPGKHVGTTAAATGPEVESTANTELSPHAVYGVVVSTADTAVLLRTRTQRLLTVDAGAAMRDHLTVRAVAGQALLVRGDYDARGVLHASAILRAKDLQSLWAADK